MKKKNLLLSFLILAGISVFAQQTIPVSQVPANVKNTFQTNYPNATNVTWQQQEQVYFIPTFTDNNVQTKMVIDLKGNRILSSTKIAATDLPQTATDYISAHYSGTAITDVQKISMLNRSTRYEAMVGTTDLIFDSNGAFIKITNNLLKQ
jgi:hypothetical protein